MTMATSPRRVVFATPPIYQAPLPLEVHLPMIPQGPAMLAAVLRARGHHVACYDAYERSCRERLFDPSAFAAFLAAEAPDWIGLSVYSDGFPAALSMIKIIKAVLPKSRIVVGGPHFTLFPDAVPPEVDFVVVGEGELAMPALVEGEIPPISERTQVSFVVVATETDTPFDGACNFDFSVVTGDVNTRPAQTLHAVGAHVRPAENGVSRVIVMEGRLTNDILGRLPYPAYDLFLCAESKYQFDEPALGLDGPMLNLNTSRGCSYGCSFCSVEGVWGKAYRWFPSTWVVGLVTELKRKHGLRSVFFREDEFIMGPRAPSAWREGAEGRDDVLALAYGMKELGITWAIENRADAFGSQERAQGYFKTLADLGLKGVFVGVESASDTVRNVILNKHLSETAIRHFFEWAHAAGVRTVANIMYGVRRIVNGVLVSDSPQDWLDTDALLSQIRPTRVDRYVYVGVPVSPLYMDHLKRGDYEFVDTNGYLYPKGFTDIARDIYGDDAEMLPLPGKPNVRVGPSLLPGIPALAQRHHELRDRVTAALAQLQALPTMADVRVAQLYRHPSSLAGLPGILDDLDDAVALPRVPSAIIAEITKLYHPGDKPRIVRLAGGPTFALATLRTPSAETVLLAARLDHDPSQHEAIIAFVRGVAALLNDYLRARFIEAHATASDVDHISHAKPRMHAVQS